MHKKENIWSSLKVIRFKRTKKKLKRKNKWKREAKYWSKNMNEWKWKKKNERMKWEVGWVGDENSK